jgi:hypothetical protein
MTREESVRMIKALPTMYNGTLYRSRTEARWAVFLDELFKRPAFYYEAQGYIVPGGNGYLPDFLLPGQSLYAEVKPAIDFDPEGVQKLRCLVAGHGKMRGAVLPDIAPGQVRLLLIGPDHGETWEDDNAAWMTCPEGYHHDIKPYFPEPGCAECGIKGGYWHESDAITAAYTAARSHRFSMPPRGE